MRSQTIFKFYSTWRGRYGDEHGSEIIIFSNFDDPAQWPFQVKRYAIDFDEDTYDEIREEVKSFRISKDVFEKIKASIASNQALKNCEGNIENDVHDGSCDEFRFECDSFVKTVGGLSILGSAYYEEDHPERRTANYVVKKAYDGIMEILEKAGIQLY